MRRVSRIRFLVRAAAACAAAALALACTVLSDRGRCPSYLYVAFPQRAELPGEVRMLAWDPEKEAFDRIIGEVNGPEADPFWIWPVLDGTYDVSACRGLDACFFSYHCVFVPVGSQMDSLYAWHGVMVASGGNVEAEAVLRKQFATVSLDIRKDAVIMQDVEFLVEGGTRGFDLFSFLPVKGAFSYSFACPEGGTVASFRCPRQADAHLSVEVFHRGHSMGVFPVGEYILESGYDWSEEDLRDIRLTIDLNIGSAAVFIGGWEHGADIPFVQQ